MKKTLLVGTFAAFLFSAQTCSSTDIPGTIAKVQAAAVQTCSFIPTAGTITAIIETFNPGLAAPLDMAQAICAAVSSQRSLRRIQGEVKVNNVPIHGNWVEK